MKKFNEVVVRCKICGKKPNEINEYIERAKYESEYFDSPEDVVIQDEGTFNPLTGLFYCTECYIKVGMPLGQA